MRDEMLPWMMTAPWLLIELALGVAAIGVFVVSIISLSYAGAQGSWMHVDRWLYIGGIAEEGTRY